MTLLLDTHIVLWALADAARLSPRVAAAIQDAANAILVSAATAFEIAVKQSLGKLRLPGQAEQWLPEAVANLGAEWLPVTPAHALAVRSLPWHHRDPFDRLLIAQTGSVGMLVTHDRAFAPYGLSVLWNHDDGAPPK